MEGLNQPGPWDADIVDETIEVATAALREGPRLHVWWAQRSKQHALAALSLATDVSAAVGQQPDLTGLDILDACSGSGTIAATAASLGARSIGVDSSPLATLIARLSWQVPEELRKSTTSETGELLAEFRRAIDSLITEARRIGGETWRVDVDFWRLKAHWNCAVCGTDIPAEMLAARQRLCEVCGARLVGRELAGISAVTGVARDGEKLKELEHFTVRAWPLRGLAAKVLREQDRAWEGPWGPFRAREILPEPSAFLLGTLVASFEHVVGELAARPEQSHAEAVRSYVALALSSILPTLTAACSLPDRGAFPLRSPMNRPTFALPVQPATAGPRQIETALLMYWRRVANAVTLASTTDGRATYLQTDLANFQTERRFDIVVWDPPYFDNIDYEAVQRPFVRLLRQLLGRQIDALPGGNSPGRSSYWESLRQQAETIRAHLKNNGRVSVFWTARDADGFSEFLGMLREAGLRPVRVVRLVDFHERRIAELGLTTSAARPRQYVIVLQSAAPFSGAGQAIDSKEAFDLADEGRPVLFHGLAEVLSQEWDPEDYAQLPADYRGSELNRLTEYVAHDPDPSRLLADLGVRALRQRLLTAGRDRSTLEGLNVNGLAREVMKELGFTSPGEPAYSPFRDLEELASSLDGLELAPSRSAIFHATQRAAAAYERLVRWTVSSWAELLKPDAPALAMQSASERLKREWKTIDKLSLGDWVALWPAMLSLETSDDSIRRAQDYAKRAIKKQRVIAASDALVALRNSVVHDKEDIRGMDDAQLRRHSTAITSTLRKAVNALDEAKALPRVLQPQWERLDNLGRRLVHATDDAGRPVEFYTSYPTDLTKPVLWFFQGANPRDTDPLLVPSALR